MSNGAKPKIIVKQPSPDQSFELILVSSTPKTSKWVLTQLRIKSLRDGLLQWQIGFEPFKEQLITWHGTVGGKIQVKVRKVELNNSKRTIQEQALLQARQKYMLNIRKGYLPVGSTEVPMIKIMRAEEYIIDKHKLNFPLSVETKLNGIRLWVRKNHVVEGYSRGNKLFTHITHILNECEKFLNYLPYNAAIDGEMFHHDLDFTEITSIVRTEKFQHQLMPMLEYYIFDIWWPDNPPYETRRQVLEDAIKLYREDHFGGTTPKDTRTREDFMNLQSSDADNVTKLFLTERVIVNSVEDIFKQHQIFVQNGYEGTMIKRHANDSVPGTREYTSSTYLFGKGNRILKLKDWYDEEAECIGVQSASGTEKNCAMLLIRDIRGNEFYVRMGGPLERRRYWYEHPESIIGKQITFKYQTLSIYGVPIFPVGLEVRDYE